MTHANQNRMDGTTPLIFGKAARRSGPRLATTAMPRRRDTRFTGGNTLGSGRHHAAMSKRGFGQAAQDPTERPEQF